ncbi:MAG TPA: hypothetical protein ENK84_08175 [Desulfobulbus sp.]|nr:hypothetical protein [Desulfobulbus sp.]
MKCHKAVCYLNAYADGELTGKLQCLVRDHLATCEKCRMKLEEIRSLERVVKNSLQVPPVPEGLAARTMAKARQYRSRLASESDPLVSTWNPLLWTAQLSASMKLTVCATVLSALVAGLFLNGGQGTGPDMRIESGDTLYGLEWFDPAPPGSISLTYIAMAEQSYE